MKISPLNLEAISRDLAEDEKDLSDLEDAQFCLESARHTLDFGAFKNPRKVEVSQGEEATRLQRENAHLRALFAGSNLPLQSARNYDQGLPGGPAAVFEKIEGSVTASPEDAPRNVCGTGEAVIQPKRVLQGGFCEICVSRTEGSSASDSWVQVGVSATMESVDAVWGPRLPLKEQSSFVSVLMDIHGRATIARLCEEHRLDVGPNAKYVCLRFTNTEVRLRAHAFPITTGSPPAAPSKPVEGALPSYDEVIAQKQQQQQQQEQTEQSHEHIQSLQEDNGNQNQAYPQ